MKNLNYSYEELEILANEYEKALDVQKKKYEKRMGGCCFFFFFFFFGDPGLRSLSDRVTAL